MQLPHVALFLELKINSFTTMSPEALIEKYFTDTLTSKEQQALVNYLAKNPDKAKAFEDRKQMEKSSVQTTDEAKPVRLPDFQAHKPASTAEEEESRRLFIRYAIGAAIIIGLTLLFVKLKTA